MADPAYIQDAVSVVASATAATTITKAYTTANLTAGSVLCCAAAWGTTNCTPTCADSVNGAWTAGPKLWNADDSAGLALFFFTNNASTATPTVTVSFAGNSVAYRNLHIMEIGPANTTTQPDVAGTIAYQATPGTGANAITSGEVISVTNGALAYGYTVDSAGVEETATLAAGTGYAERLGFAGPAQGAASETRTVTTAGSVAATFTDATQGGGENYLTAIMVFRPEAGGGASIGGALNVHVRKAL